MIYFYVYVYLSDIKKWSKIDYFNPDNSQGGITSSKEVFLQKPAFLLGKILTVNLFYGNKGKNISSCANGFSMEIESSCSENVSTSILEKQDKFLSDKSKRFPTAKA